MWGFLGPLVKENNDKASVYRNVPRHNGLEAWRRLAEPINADKSMMRKDLLPLVNNPKCATNMEDVEAKLEDWNTNCRLMVENGGEMPSDETRRMAFVEMLPPDIMSHVMMNIDLPGFETFNKVKKYTLRYIKVLQKSKNKRKGQVNIVDREALGSSGGSDVDDDDDDWSLEREQIIEHLDEVADKALEFLAGLQTQISRDSLRLCLVTSIKVFEFLGRTNIERLTVCSKLKHNTLTFKLLPHSLKPLRPVARLVQLRTKL